MKKIAFISDIHLDEKFPIEQGVDTRGNWNLILQDVATRKVDEIIFGGDIGERESAQWFFESLKNYPSLNVILGNHDHFSEVGKYYTNNYFQNKTELYYAYEDDFLKYIYLDSSTDTISDIQFEWFQQELFSSKKIILFIHHPILEINTAVDKLYPLKNRKKIKQELLKHKNEVYIFCGHYHMIDERTDGSIKQFITPATSYQVKKESSVIEIETDTFGYRVISIDKGEINSDLFLFKNGSF